MAEIMTSFSHFVLLGNIENHETIHFYSCLHGSQEIDRIKTNNITFYRLYNNL